MSMLKRSHAMISGPSSPAKCSCPESYPGVCFPSQRYYYCVLGFASRENIARMQYVPGCEYGVLSGNRWPGDEFWYLEGYFAFPATYEPPKYPILSGVFAPSPHGVWEEVSKDLFDEHMVVNSEFAFNAFSFSFSSYECKRSSFVYTDDLESALRIFNGCGFSNVLYVPKKSSEDFHCFLEDHLRVHTFVK